MDKNYLDKMKYEIPSTDTLTDLINPDISEHSDNMLSLLIKNYHTQLDFELCTRNTVFYITSNSK